MRKLSTLCESLWADVQSQAAGDAIKQEVLANIAAKAVIDGEQYYFMNDFMSMGDEYINGNGEKWTAFAFNKMPDGSKFISGDTDAAGAFGKDKWDIGYDEYDVYALKDYLNMSSDQLAKRSINWFWKDCGQIYMVGDIQNIIEKYIKDVFVNHMSDYAAFWINEVSNTDLIDERFVISVCEGTDYGEMEVVKDEFEDRHILTAHLYLYPKLNGWTENLEKELIDEYEKEGWVKSETFEVDYDVVPDKTSGLCFVKFDDDFDEDEEDEEDI